MKARGAYGGPAGRLGSGAARLAYGRAPRGLGYAAVAAGVRARLSIGLAAASLLAATPLAASAQAGTTTGASAFATRCAGCHGADARGGEHAPNIVDSAEQGGVDSRSPQRLREIITQGIRGGGMPAFALPPHDLNAIVAYIEHLRAPAAAEPPAGDVAAGERFFFGSGGCVACHMMRGHGGVLGPDLTSIGERRRVSQIEAALNGEGARGVTVRLTDGDSIRGLVKNESNYDLQLLDLEGRLHLLDNKKVQSIARDMAPIMPPLRATPEERRDLIAYLSRSHRDTATSGRVAGTSPGTDTAAFAEVRDPPPGDWPTYHGRLNGNRFSPLRMVDTTNVGQLAPQWMYSISDAKRLEVTPVVVGGVMYVTAANEAFALDARTGRQIWHYSRPLTKGVIGDAGGAINRGVAVRGDRVFMVTDDAHLIALTRVSGELVWDVEMADFRRHYGATSAPLVVGDLVISGTSGGDEGDRGFIDAYRASTGAHVWRFWTMPAPGDSLARTWRGRAIEHGCVAAWLTGTYDVESGLLYWPTGNPCPDYNGDQRVGDNLYSSSVVALDPATGHLKWYYQFTPHDLHDWDAAQPLLLVDARVNGESRHLLAEANRNGFFYLLDRNTGQFIRGTPFVHKLTWASGIAANGRPVVLPGSEPTQAGTRVCPSVEGATNWMSSSYDAATGLFYIMALESCAIYSKSADWWHRGQSFYGGGVSHSPSDTAQKVLRAIDLSTGRIAWEIPQVGSGESWGGVLSTAGGLVFYADDAGALAAVNARTGNPLWHFNTSQSFRASPMTYAVDGRQYVAIAAGSSVIAFALSGGD